MRKLNLREAGWLAQTCAAGRRWAKAGAQLFFPSPPRCPYRAKARSAGVFNEDCSLEGSCSLFVEMEFRCKRWRDRVARHSSGVVGAGTYSSKGGTWRIVGSWGWILQTPWGQGLTYLSLSFYPQYIQECMTSHRGLSLASLSERVASWSIWWITFRGRSGI